jgi:UDP-N-acetylmuramyl pentapeptide phosphotransferase/UDP-N-acetylglucosamine-1-phosphate transferase
LIAVPEWLPSWALFGAMVVASGALTYLLIIALQPVLRRYALAQPNARSSHTVPTPQGGGIAVVTSTIAVAVLAVALLPPLNVDLVRVAPLFGMAAMLAMLGTTDDIHPMEALPRLLLQIAAVSVLIFSLPFELRVLSIVPWWLERVLLIVGGVWFVNLVNFMDGIDWMTVVELVPITAALAVFGLMGALPRDATVVTFALCGAMIGFAPFNRPVARLFLGDVGSLPIGLLVGWLLLNLAADGHLAAALLLPLYYLADTTITLLLRLARSERMTQAHRSHFYQRAVAAGFSVPQVVARVFAANLALVVLATATVRWAGAGTSILALLAGAALVGWLLASFAKGRR